MADLSSGRRRTGFGRTAGLGLAGAALVGPADVAGMAAMLLTILCADVVSTDLGRYRIREATVAGMVAAGLAVSLCSPDPQAPLRALTGAAGGALGFAAVRWAFQRLTRRHGMGSGDVGLAGGTGAWVGGLDLGPTIVLSVVLSTAWLGWRRAASGRWPRRLPYGAGLAAATWIAAVRVTAAG